MGIVRKKKPVSQKIRIARHVGIIESLPLKKPVLAEPLHGGITNFNYKIHAAHHVWVARFSTPSNYLLGLNRPQEIFNTQIAHNLKLGPKVGAYYPAHHLLILEFIPGTVLSKKHAREKTVIKKIARMLKKLHSSRKRFKGTFNPFDTIRGYLRIVKRKKGWLPKDIEPVMHSLSKIEEKLGPLFTNYPCHLDMMIANVIRTKHGLKLLDWEYSAMSDYRFDLGMFSMKGNFSPKDDHLLLNSYGEPSHHHAYEELQSMKAVAAFREASWGLLQNCISHVLHDYKGYANAHFAKFKKIARYALKK